MFWAFRVQDEIRKRFAATIEQGTSLVIRDEKTMSGRVHVGSLRGVVIHGLVSEILSESDVANRFLFEINDFDPMDGLPVYVDQEFYKPYMGRLLCDVPAPAGSGASNYAEHWADDFMQVVSHTGFTPDYYRSSTLYRDGKYNDAIKQALDQAGTIRRIYKEVSGSDKGSDWFPIQVVCESCQKVGTTRATAWDGKKVTYRCEKAMVKWAEGCGHEGSVDPFDGRAKLPWKVEWAAKFKVKGVHIEGAGKDHATKGGARDVARHIVQEVFDYPEPYDIPYNFFVVGGKKMSSSKGKGSSAREVGDLLPTHILRLLMMKEPKREIDFEPHGDTIPILYDTHDKIASQYFVQEKNDWTSVFPFVYAKADRPPRSKFLPRFSQIAYLGQMPHISLDNAVKEMKGSQLTEEERTEMNKRSTYAHTWLKGYSPEKYRLEIQTSVPQSVKEFTDKQRDALRDILSYMKANPGVKGAELHTFIHEVKKKTTLSPDQLFSALYISFLGKESGPQAGWFLSALPRDFVLERLTEVTS
ncbi:MAG: lysine--tRNA ligase [Patescibacteria group bacterium]